MRPILPVGRHQESFRPFDTLIALGDPEAVQSAYWMTKAARMNGQLRPLLGLDVRRLGIDLKDSITDRMATRSRFGV